MKKMLTYCIVLFTAVYLCVFSVHAHYYEPAKAEIEVEIKLGGSVVIIPDEKSPSPAKTEMQLKDGETGRFDIAFSTVGVYDYTVKTIPDERNLIFDKTVYYIKIYVNDEDGDLTLTYIVYKGDRKYEDDPKTLVFVNTVPGSDIPPPAPNTNDDSKTKLLFMLVFIALAGSLELAAHFIGRKKRNV